MKPANKIKNIFIIAGDILALYLSLFLTLVLRYGSNFEMFIDSHLMPFTIIFVPWLLVFYIAGLYDPKRLRNNMEFLKTLSLAITVNAALTMFFFYTIPYFGITPKTNLLIFLIVFAAIEIVWRRSFNKTVASFQDKTKIALVGSSRSAQEISDFIKDNPQLGYETAVWLKSKEDFSSLGGIPEWKKLIEENGIDIIVIPRYFKNEPEAAKIFYKLLTLGEDIVDIPSFYETIFQKIPIDDISEEWFLDEIVEKEKFYDNFKRWLEFVFALALGIVLLPLEILIAILIKITSAGPVIYRQVRVGENGNEFVLYKFRTMRTDAEANGPKWAGKKDPRATAMGSFLRHTHLDELPQLFNIIKGEISFVGPRPERPEFTKVLEGKIPHYDVRHLIKPGVTGWAQINYRYGASEEDAAEKLRYDIYYLKNRSPILDIAIILKTLKSFFINQK
ncbi:MAG TPA: sugar transferase [Candidatus Paceibacterota bacterium]|nr:sugar transferase [Candidatus Paceibacterota bacterium]